MDGFTPVVAALTCLMPTLLGAWLTARLTRGLALVPTHFGITGKADGFGPRWVSIVLIPAIQTLLAALLLNLPFLELPVHGDQNAGILFAQVICGLSMAFAQALVFVLMRRWRLEQ